MCIERGRLFRATVQDTLLCWIGANSAVIHGDLMSTSRWVALGAALVSCMLSIRLFQIRGSVDNIRERAAGIADSLAVARAEREVLMGYLASQLASEQRSTPIVHGHVVQLKRANSFSPRNLDLIYVLDPDCKPCEANFPKLDSLARLGARIVAISGRSNESTGEEYARKFNLRFPLVIRPDGPLSTLSEGGITPLTLMFRGGRMINVRVGRLADRDLTFLIHQSPLVTRSIPIRREPDEPLVQKQIHTPGHSIGTLSERVVRDGQPRTRSDGLELLSILR